MTFVVLWLGATAGGQVPDWTVEFRQLTVGPKHHFFGYIGQAGTIPWNASGRFIVALQSAFQDRMPRADDAAAVILIDTEKNNAVEAIDSTRAWNFQQGTMFYWNPRAADTQFFFNDRDPATNKVFAVLYDISKRKRVREYRFDDMPIGNSGVAQKGGRFLGINYGRLARLRPVTGYPEAFDSTAGRAAPDDDGVFIVDVDSGKRRLLASFQQLADAIAKEMPERWRAADTGKGLFINHTLWSRDDTRIYFYVRASFAAGDKRLDVPVSIHPDGSGLIVHQQHIGGHPDWESATRVIGAVDGKMVLYDVDARRIVETIGGREVFPRVGGDVALAPKGDWLVIGDRVGTENFYVIFRRTDGTSFKTRGFPHPGYTSGELRIDGSPCWNRRGDEFLFPALAADGTRQLFAGKIKRR